MSFINASDLHKAFGGVPALESFDLQVEKGEIFALVGPDGAGKTTLMRILCNLVHADGGEASIGGLDIRRDFEKIKPLLGYMPQVFSLYPDLSVEENLKFYAGIYGITGARYEEKREYLYGFSNLGPFSGRRALALSGGMKQKLALSCALMHDPGLLILDEPTTGVDPLSRSQFWEILSKLKSGGVTILLSTPYMDEVARADRAAFILGGRKLSEGTPAEMAGQFEGLVYFLGRRPTSDLMKKLGSIQGISAQRFGAGLHIYLGENDVIGNHAAELERAGIDGSALIPTDATLEDRFIQLVGMQS